MKIVNMKSVLNLMLAFFLGTYAIQSLANTDEEVSLLLAESDTEELEYSDFADEPDFSEDSEDYGESQEVAEKPDELKAIEPVDQIVEAVPDVPPPTIEEPEVALPVAPTPPRKMASENKKPKVKKKNKNKVAQKKYKGKFRKLKKDCNMRSIASVSGKKVGMAKKRKKLWAQQINEKWIEVQRKSGPAYISESCFNK